VKVKGLSGVEEITVGRAHTCARRADHVVLCWGQNTDGQLGDGTTQDRVTPTPVVGLPAGDPVVDLSGGRESTCAVAASGTILCWGWNPFGQLGDGTSAGRARPGPVKEISDGVTVGCDMNHCCALRRSGAVVCWGANFNGQLGDGTVTNRPVPVPVKGLPAGVVEVAANKGTSCALLAAGPVYCWGDSSSGAVGGGVATGDVLTPVANGVLDGVQLGRRGWVFGCALRSQGRVSCWGSNSAGQLGDGSTASRASPVEVAGLTDAVEVGTGHYHVCARRRAGEIVCWGSREDGKLGTGAAGTGAQTTPVLSKYVP